MPTPAVPQSSRHWAEVDLLRALAGVLMIVNHAGVAWLPDSGARGGFDGGITFVGSLAPVFFFTVTGVGRGIQSASGRALRSFWEPLRTALVLFMADATLWLSPTKHFGLDFLGFIALSTLVVEVVHRTRWPGAVAGAGAIACLCLRFVVAPRVGVHSESLVSRGVTFLVGTAGIPGQAYALFPWLAYPLFGSLVGRFAARHAEQIRASRGGFAARSGVVAALGFGLSVALFLRHATFFRWGSMSFAYCIFGFSAVFAGLSLVLAVVSLAPGSAVRALSLPGLSSFVVVPIHYAVVDFIHPPPSVIGAGLLFPIGLLVVVPIVLALSKGLDSRMRMLASRKGPLWTPALLLLTLALLFAIARADGPLPLRLFTQLLACGLFALLSSKATTSAVTSLRPPLTES